MDEPVIAQRAPYIKDMAPGTYYWCACGRSKTQPFCDGSHKGTGFSPQEVIVDKPTKLVFCGCKHTATPPLCDGAHRSLPR